MPKRPTRLVSALVLTALLAGTAAQVSATKQIAAGTTPQATVTNWGVPKATVTGVNNDPKITLRPDLTITQVTLGTSSVRRGEAFRVAATVKNLGPGSAPASMARFLVWPSGGPGGPQIPAGQQPTTLTVQVSVPALSPGASASITSGVLTFPANTPPGAYLVQVNADFGNAIGEVNETNNTQNASGSLNVQ